MRWLAFLVLGVGVFFALNWAGAAFTTDVATALWPGQSPGELASTVYGAALFGAAAVGAGALILLPFRSRRRKPTYPSSLSELDSYTGFISRD